MNFVTNCLHRSVLPEESVELLNVKPGGVYLDATFGCGGHSSLILSRLNHRGRLLAVDRDPESIKIAKNTRDRRLIPIHAPFSRVSSQISRGELSGKVDGILLDLGMSSLQLDNPGRGFSFLHDGPLNMSMDSTSGMAAADWLRNSDVDEIYSVLRNFGEERFASRIARSVVLEGHKQPILSTGRLSDLIRRTVPPGKKHPARRSFMAIRIHVNDELGELRRFLDDVPSMLSRGGRLVIISFHSLEDRVVKNFIRHHSGEDHWDRQSTNGKVYADRCPMRSFKKIRPSAREVESNPRSRSAILRSAEKLC